MADRVSASITIGGTLDAAVFEELADIIASEGLAIEWDGGPFEPHHHVPGQPLRLFAHEVAGGSFDELESWCLSHGLPFVRWCGGYSGQWGPERVVATGDGSAASYAVTEDDEVVISRSTVEKLGSHEAVVAHFDAAEFAVPPLVVRSVDADTQPGTETAMSNSFTKAAFGIAVTSAEADLLRRVAGAVQMIDNADVSLEELEARYRDLGEDFATLFPRTPESPFDGLLDLFPDENYPSLDFDIEFGEPNSDGQVVVFFSGEQFGVETAAKLIQRCTPSALPFGFEWASDCDRLRAGEFGGGYVAITADTIEYSHTSLMLDRAIARASDEGADGYVLATSNAEYGLSFWNNEDGFGSLARATVFSEAEAGNFDIPIADDQPAWLAMPAPLRF